MPSPGSRRPALTADWQNAGFGVYVHWPFCAAKCPYCDFNSHVRTGGVDQSRWASALDREIRATAERTGPRTVSTVFFGGGTPSLMNPDTVEAVLQAIDDAWTLSADAEITLEANPTSVETGKFRAFAGLGVNRLSMGVQTLNDADLKALGRLHSVYEARQAFETARKSFKQVSFDLIYARQNQSLEDWRSELTEALSMAVDHLSLYQLTIEPETRFGELHARGRLRGLPSDGLAADMYDLTQEVCATHGMPAYEVSNHAQPGAESRHNLIYWRYGDYAGIGPGAHGRLSLSGTRWATETPRHPETWLTAAENGGAVRFAEEISPANQAAEYLMMALRLDEGASVSRARALERSVFSARALAELRSSGHIEVLGDRLRATLAGRLVLNRVLAELLAEPD